jgi:hypothetical protein
LIESLTNHKGDAMKTNSSPGTWKDCVLQKQREAAWARAKIRDAAPELLSALTHLLSETQKLWGRPSELIKIELEAQKAIDKALGKE